MSQLKKQFWLKPIYFRLILGGLVLVLKNNVSATGCPSGVLTTGSQTIVCNAGALIATPISTYSTSNPPPSGSPSLTSNAYDNINVTVENGTTIQLSGSPIGLASGSTVTNNGVLNSSSFTNGYGISFGVNGRSNAGGNSVTNTASGEIQTGGSNADGIIISSRLAGSSGNSAINQGLITTSGAAANGIFIRSGSSNNLVTNSISNAGTISTSGVSAYGISLDSTSGVNGISNTGTITTSGANSHAIVSLNTRNVVDITNSGTIQASGLGADAININGAAIVTNSGTITSASGLAVNFTGALPAGKFNTLNVNAGSVINGGIAFNQFGTQETLTFTGYINPNFNNAVLNVNSINVLSGSAVTMNSSAGYTLVGGQIDVAAGLDLKIDSAIRDKSSSISGVSSITKDGLGTLSLSGANTYTGTTTINAGAVDAVSVNTLPVASAVTVASGASLNMLGNSQSIGSLAGSGTVSMGAGTLTTGNDNTDTIFSGTITGTGGLNKVGSGIFTLDGSPGYSGDTVINSGVLRLLTGIDSDFTIGASGTLQGGVAIAGNVMNAGNIQPSFNGTPSNLTIVGNYVGNGGTFTTQVHTPTASPIADQLIISGAGNSSSGSTGITVIDRGGLGNATTGDGIVLVNAVNGATTGSGTFVLSGRAASGAYEYQLYRGDKAGNGSGWYLRTEDESPPPVPVTPAVSQRIEVALYPALPSLVRLYSMTVVDSLDQRRGDLNLVDPQGPSKGISNDWARIIGKTGTSSPSTVGDGPKMNFNAYALQFGVDLYRNERLDGSRTYVGPYATIGSANGGVSNQAGTTNTGNIGMQAYSLGLYATHFASNGLYVDALAQGSRYLRAQAISVENAQIQTQGTGFTGSLETGGRWHVNKKWIVSPQAQIVYDSIGMDNASDAYGQMNFAKDETSRGRLGIMLGHQDLKAKVPVFAYLRASVWDVFQSGSNTAFQSLYGVNPVNFQSQTGSRWLAIDAQFGARLTHHTSAFINAGWENSLVGTYQAISGRIGIQTRF